jgi:hypothetical protein
MRDPENSGPMHARKHVLPAEPSTGILQMAGYARS